MVGLSYRINAFLPTLGLGLSLALFPPTAVAHEGHATAAPRLELGSSAAFGPDDALYVVSKRGERIILERSVDLGQHWEVPVPVNTDPEAISADGENRPKLAFSNDGAVLVAWTRPLKKAYTGEIRFARSADGKRFDPPITVHRDRAEITHRFESMLVLRDGRVVIAWIDKRDQEAAKAKKTDYRGAAIYSAVSTDSGRSFQPEKKVADYSCECCRIAMAEDLDGAPLLLWRAVFAPNERDHALTKLRTDGTAQTPQRATFDRWKIDACPHHGPSLAVDAAGVRHAVWFNFREGEGRVFYGRLPQGEATQVERQQTVGGKRAQHADIAVNGQTIAIVWTEFDGDKTRLLGMLSDNGGRDFRPLRLDATEGASSQALLLKRDDRFYAFWRTEREGLRVLPLP